MDGHPLSGSTAAPPEAEGHFPALFCSEIELAQEKYLRSGRWNAVTDELLGAGEAHSQTIPQAPTLRAQQLCSPSQGPLLCGCGGRQLSSLNSRGLRLRLRCGPLWPLVAAFLVSTPQLFQQPWSPNSVLNALCSEWLPFSSSNPDRSHPLAFLFPNPPLSTHTHTHTPPYTHIHTLAYKYTYSATLLVWLHRYLTYVTF